MRRLVFFFFPGGVLLIAAAFAVRGPLFSAALPAVSRVYPYVVLGIGVFFGWRFHRSRLAYGVLVLFLVDRLLIRASTGQPLLWPAFSPVAADAAAVLLPLNLLIFSLQKKHGLMTLRGMLHLMFIASQPAVIILAHVLRPDLLSGWLRFDLFPVSFVTPPLHQPAMTAFAVAAVLMGFFFTRDLDVMKQGFFWATASAFAGLVFAAPGTASTIYFSTAGLILVLSAVEAVYGMAYRDELTNLPARRALNEALSNLRRRYTIAMIDIDHFKKFNDRFGHDVGDQVLCMVAAKLGRVDGGGRAFRYGGEEFAIVFPNKSKDKTAAHLEKLRRAVSAAGFKIRAKNRPKKKPEGKKQPSGPARRVSVTVSIGVAERTEKWSRPSEVIRAADQALYKAKKKGRNRVVVG